MTDQNRAPLAERILLLMFAVSGFSALIYQSVWTSYLGNLLGHAAYAQTLVLAIFMGGMAIGAWWAGRRADQVQDPLLRYAVVEALIGICALVFHPIFVAAAAFCFGTVIPHLHSPAAVQAFKWLLAAGLILPQSVLLGMTFPLMTTGVMRRLPDAMGRLLAGLYFTNSLGATFGALVATFWLVPNFGLPGALRSAGALNLLVAAVAAWVAKRYATTKPLEQRVEQQAQDPGLLKLVLLGSALTGASSFVYEIGWVRMLNLALGSSVHSFEIMLSAFIGGLALGGWYIRKRIDSLVDPLRAAGIVQVLMALAALASLPFYSSSFEWTSWLMATLSRTDSGYALFSIGSSMIAILIMAPTAFFAGMTLPLFTLALLRKGHGERSVGAVYAVNTLGAIVGVFLAVHLLIPVLGLKSAMIVGALIDAGLGLKILHLGARADSGSRKPFMAAAVIAALAFGWVITQVQFDPMRMASGVFRSGKARLNEDTKVLFQRDGKTATVSFTVNSHGTGSISTNGKSDAAISLDDLAPPAPDEYTMTMAALLPLSMHDKPSQIGVIGFGSGLTTHTFLGDPRVQSVDTIEIEPAMYAAAHGFGERVERAYNDPRSHVHIEDAKTFFSSHATKYDVIISEPSNPWVSGVAGLFSTEFYRFVPQHLNPNGIFVQWLQMYEIDMALSASVIKSLQQVFPHISVFESYSGDLIIVATPESSVSLEPRIDVLKSPMLLPLATRMKVLGVEDLRVRWVGDETSLRPLSELFDLAANSDYYPVLAYRAPAARFRNDTAALLPSLARSMLSVPSWLSKRSWPSADQVTGEGTETGTRIRLARVLAHQLREPTGHWLDDAPNPLQRTYDALAGASARCQIDRERATIHGDLYEVAELILPFADVEDRSSVWSAPFFDTCLRKDAEMALVLDLYAALASRDLQRIAGSADQILGRDAKTTAPAVIGLALTSAVLSATLQGQRELALELDRKWSPRIRGTKVSTIELDYLLAVARASPAKGSVANGADAAK